jgi:hypothetical protein
MPLRALRLLSEAEIQKLFSNIEVIVNVNREVLKDMDQLIGKIENLNSPTAIGTVFGKMSAFFKTYTVYCSNQPAAVASYAALGKNPQFKSFMDVCHSDARCKGLNLFDFLIKPVQRICKYPLLLRELLKHTPEDHPDFLSLDLAKRKIDEVTESINEGKRYFEQLQKMMEIQELVEGSVSDFLLFSLPLLRLL